MTLHEGYSPMNNASFYSGEATQDFRMNKAFVNVTGVGVDSSATRNHTLDENMAGPGCYLYDFLTESILAGILCLFGYTGNTLSMICLSRDKSKTATPFLLVSLELADTLFLIAVFFLRVLPSISSYTGRFETLVRSVGPYLGKYVYPSALTAETLTIYLTILVTVNRYVSVCRPYEASNLCSMHHAKRHVIIVILFSIAYNIPRFFQYTITTAPDSRTIVVASEMGRSKYYQILYGNVLYFLVMFLIPLITLIILNYKLIAALRKTQRRRAQLLNNTDSSHSRSEDDITLVLIVVVLVFVICQAPALVTQVLTSMLDSKSKDCPGAFFYYERISDLMIVANSSMNFIIYCFCSRKFRQILVCVLCKRAGTSPEHSVTQTPRMAHSTRVVSVSSSRKPANDTVV